MWIAVIIALVVIAVYYVYQKPGAPKSDGGTGTGTGTGVPDSNPANNNPEIKS